MGRFVVIVAALMLATPALAVTINEAAGDMPGAVSATSRATAVTLDVGVNTFSGSLAYSCDSMSLVNGTCRFFLGDTSDVFRFIIGPDRSLTAASLTVSNLAVTGTGTPSVILTSRSGFGVLPFPGAENIPTGFEPFGDQDFGRGAQGTFDLLSGAYLSDISFFTTPGFSGESAVQITHNEYGSAGADYAASFDWTVSLTVAGPAFVPVPAAAPLLLAALGALGVVARRRARA